MQLLSLAIFLSFSLTALGQDYPDSGFTNKAEAKNLMVNGKKEGKWCEYLLENGNKTTSAVSSYCTLTIYKAGKPYGIEREYCNGKLCTVMPYKNGVTNGTVKSYFEDGKLNYEAPFVDSIENGTEKDYYDNGKLKGEVIYANGKRNGIAKWYNKKGKLECQATYVNDSVTNGVVRDDCGENETEPEKRYYVERPYVNGKENGLEKTFYDNGVLAEETPIKNGSVDGIVKKYNRYNGKLAKTLTVVHDHTLYEDPIELDFGCGWAGIDSPEFYTVKELLKTNNDTGLVKLIYSENITLKLIAIVAIENKLAKRKIALSDADQKIINDYIVRKDEVYACEGCTNHEDYTVAEIFSSSKNGIRSEINRRIGQ